MSHIAQQWALEVKGVTTPQFAILIYLGYKHNEDLGLIFPHQKTICEKIKMTPDTLRRNLIDLQRMGFIQRIEIREDGKTTTYYILRLDKFEPDENWREKPKEPPLRLSGGQIEDLMSDPLFEGERPLISAIATRHLKGVAIIRKEKTGKEIKKRARGRAKDFQSKFDFPEARRTSHRKTQSLDLDLDPKIKTIRDSMRSKLSDPLKADTYLADAYIDGDQLFVAGIWHQRICDASWRVAKQLGLKIQAFEPQRKTG